MNTLYHKGKKGELRQWRIWTEGADIVTEYGQVDGQMQISRKAASAKNVGRANETSPERQAELEAQSMWTYKVERKYAETPEGAQEQLPLPMLAHKFEGSKKKKFTYPAHIQPKLDGVRCLAQRDEDGQIVLTSRQGKPWNIPLVASQLDEWLEDGMTLDGELYVHGESCQRVTSWAKSSDPNGKSYKPESSQLVYHIYDIPVIDGDESLTWEERANRMYVPHVIQESDNVAIVDGIIVDNEAEMWTQYKLYMSEGYEGAILRAFDGQYLWGYRSAGLLKVKKFQDAEFTVASARDGKGKMEGCVIFLCGNDLTDGTFECTMKVPMAERRLMYEQRDQYIGRKLTVRFFDRTDDQIPRFPVGIVFRDKIDLPS